MADKKVIAVLSATGAQGGGLVRAILNHPEDGFAARAITRDVNSAKAKELANQGAEIAAADIDNPDSLKKAFMAPMEPIASHFSGRISHRERKNAVPLDDTAAGAILRRL